MAELAQSFTHELNAIKGYPSPYALDKSAVFDSTVTAALEGQIVVLGTDGEFEAASGDTDVRVPIFLLQNQADFDVAQLTGQTTGYGVGGGYGSGLVGLGAYELETTEFSGAIGTFTRNKAVTYQSPGSGNASRIVVSSSTGKTVIGMVTGTKTNENGISTVSFWPCWLPKYSVDLNA